MSAPEDLASVRALVSLGSRVLGHAGHADLVWGHASQRDPSDRGVWMKRNAIGFEEVGEDDCMLVDYEGEVLEGEGGRHAEWPIHTEVMAARPDIGGVCHTHAEHCVALAAAGDTLRPVSHAANLFVPPEVPVFDKTGDLIITRELGRDVAEALGEQNALFLKNHGIITTGKTLREAVVRAIVLERACRQQLLTHGFGRWATWSSHEESLSKRKNIYPDAHMNQVWEYLVRQLERGQAL
jgi:L-ribulose-5-phosphate 4-epimerase